MVNRDLPDQKYGTNLLALKEDDVRERHVFVHKSGKKQQINEYVTTGEAGDYNSMELVKTYEDHFAVLPYELGTDLSFGVEATGNAYVTEGFGRNTGMRTRILNQYNQMDIPIKELPSKEELKVSIVTTNAYKGIPYIISANGQKVAEGNTESFGSKETIVFSVPVNSFDDSKTLVFELEFPEAVEDFGSSHGYISFVTMKIE